MKLVVVTQWVRTERSKSGSVAKLLFREFGTL
jgi:hypothetical protein